MDRGALVAAIETNFCDQCWSLRGIPGAEVYEDEFVRWAITGVRFAPFNMVVRSAIPIDSADRIVGETFARFHAREVPMTWIVTSTSEPVDLAQRLSSNGLLCPEPTPGMALELARLRAPAQPPETEVRQVRSEAELDDFMDVFEKGFGLSEEATAGFAQLFRTRDRSQYRHYVAYERGRPCSVASSFIANRVAGIYGVTTILQARRRGHASVVTFAALDDARAKGSHLGILGSSKEAYTIYRRMGFEEYCKIGVYTNAPATFDL